MSQSLPKYGLMLGNFATMFHLAPAGYPLTDGLHVGIRDTGLLVTFGAAICASLAGGGVADGAASTGAR